MELIRLPCDQGGNWKPRIDTSLSQLLKIDRALRSRIPSQSAIPATPSGPPHPLVPSLLQHGISYASLRPQRQLSTVARIKREFGRNICKLGPSHPPDGGWQDKVIAVSDGSATDDHGTGGFVAESQSKIWANGIKIPPPIHGTMSSYRGEGGALLLLLLTLLFEDIIRLEVWCDNEKLVEIFNDMDTSRPLTKLGSCLDILDMLHWAKSAWGPRLVLDWHKGHPEERDPTGISWSKVDWLNYAADKVASEQYCQQNSLNLPSLLIHERPISLYHQNHRLEDVHRRTCLEVINKKELPKLCKLYDVPIDSISWKLTATAAGNTRPIKVRKNQLKFQWEMADTNGRKAERGDFGDRVSRIEGQPFEPRAQLMMESRCRHCFQSQVETVSHILTSCPEYKELRREWYSTELQIIRDEEPDFEMSFSESVQLSSSGTLLSPSDTHIEDIMKARIPKRWASPLPSTSCRVSDDYLRGFGSRLRKLWESVWEARKEAIKIYEDSDPTEYLRKYGIT